MKNDSSGAEKTPIDGLIARLALESLDRDLFLGDPGHGQGRLFGGLVAAQSVMAAFATVDEGKSSDEKPASLLHSIHAYFLRPGRYDLPIRFVVDRISATGEPSRPAVLSPIKAAKRSSTWPPALRDPRMV